MRGHCLCGAVRFEADPLLHEANVCHCEMCRRWTGSALLVVAVPPDRVRFEGTGAIRTRQTSDWAERAWCDKCGSLLYWRKTGSPAADYELSVGLFDEPEGFPLTKEIYIDRKPVTYAFAGDRLRLTEAEHEFNTGRAATTAGK